jgi:hypothetical protein
MTKIDPVPLALDGKERLISYTASPRFYAFEVRANPGSDLDVYAEARTQGGYAALWLTDGSFNNLGVSYETDANSAHIHCSAPASGDGKLYVVVRDNNLMPGQIAVWGTGGGDPDETVPDGGACNGSCPDAGNGNGNGGASLPSPAVCQPHKWLRAVPASGQVMMAYGSKAYVFAQDGKSWTVVENESAVTQTIPFPAGITQMVSVVTEVAPNGRPLITFISGSQRYASFWDGSQFSTPVVVGLNASPVAVAHADGQGRIYAVTPNGLTEFPPSGSPIMRGNPPYNELGWNVGADGTVYVLHSRSRPSTIHPGYPSLGIAQGTAVDLFMVHLPHGSLTWSSDVLVTSNEGDGFSGIQFATAPDGSLHLAYSLSFEDYYFRSPDGVSWDMETFKDIVSKATLVDWAAAQTNIDPSDDPAEVKGGVRLVAPQDYDHVSITLLYAEGSFSIPGYYFLRRCAPFSGIKNTWPAERLAFSGIAFDPGGVAVNERGLPTVLTPAGARQDVLQ